MSNQVGLVRVLGRLDVLTLSFGAMIGWGWVVLTSGWILSGGSLGAILAFAIGGVVVLLVGLTYSELTSSMPKVGGEHVFSYRALGVPASFICTWAIILGYVSVCAFEAVAVTNVADALWPDMKQGFLWTIGGFDVYATLVVAGALGAILITYVNYIGVKPAAVFQTIFTGAIAAGGLLLILGSFFSTRASAQNMAPLFMATGSLSGIFAVLVATPFMFVGFDIIPQAAEEINLPFKQIGKVLMLSVGLAVVWYVLIILGVSRAIDNNSLRSATDIGSANAMNALYGGQWAGVLLLLAGLAGIITSWNSFMLAGSRAIYAMAHANMLPRFLAKLHPKYKTPTNAILLVGAVSLPAPLFGKKMLGWLVDAGGLGIVVAWLMVSISFVVLRRKEPEMARPFKARWGMVVGSLATILSLAVTALYFIPREYGGSPLESEEWYIFIGWTVLGVIFYTYSFKAYGRTSMEDVMQYEITSD